MTTINTRSIRPSDNKALAIIIRKALEEFNANKPGTVYFDPTTDELSAVFTDPKSKYFVAEENGVILGGSGIYPTANLPADTCELVKLYLHKDARGKGIGKLLMEKCFDAARALGYKKMYLETLPELNIAVPLYERSGFTYLPAPLGNSGHHGCDIWMIKDLSQ
ncbi:GNAT family N-acetyltransferase [Ferruginibacter sp.]